MEKFFTLENGLQFNIIVIHTIFKNTAYKAKFKFTINGKLFINTEISGNTINQCMFKCESFLETKLTAKHFDFENPKRNKKK